MADGSADLRRIAAHLKAAGKEGQASAGADPGPGDAADLAKIAGVEHLKPYRPAGTPKCSPRTDCPGRRPVRRQPRAEVRAKARDHRRKIALLDDGFINHPVYARGERKTDVENRQTGGMRPGFFADACGRARRSGTR